MVRERMHVIEISQGTKSTNKKCKAHRGTPLTHTHTEAHKEESGRSRKATLSYLLRFQFLDSPVVLLLLLFLLYQHTVSHEP